MRPPPLVAFLILLSGSLAIPQSGSRLDPDPPLACAMCDEWNVPQEPFRIFGNTYYVGTAGLASVLIASDEGLILVDGALSQSAPLIDAGIRRLGFRTEDIRLIVNSHEHYDHAAGIAALQRASGATVAASAAAARALRQGHPTPEDPQYSSGRELPFPPVRDVTIIADGEVLRVGQLAVTAHFVPGHTPGATMWTWRSCEGARCLDVVYADSLTAVSDDGFRFTGDARRPSIEEVFRRSIARLEALPCDILLAPHPGFIDIPGKLARWRQLPDVNPFVDAGACRTYAASARARLDRRVGEERR
jgi:metallo-beta-lactamase class B